MHRDAFSSPGRSPAAPAQEVLAQAEKESVLRLLTALNLACCLPLLGAYLAPWIGFRPLFGMLAIAAPVLALVNLGWVLLWLALRRRPIFLSGLTLSLGLPFGVRYLGVHPPPASVDDSALKVLTINADYFDSLRVQGPELDARVKAVCDFLRAEKPDVLCGQDFAGDGQLEKPVWDTLAELGLKSSGLVGTSIVLYSRYPTLQQQATVFEGKTNSYGWADLQGPRGTFRVYTVHLESFGLSDLPGRRAWPLEAVATLSQGLRRHAEQARLIRRSLDQCPYPRIVCGDFNDVPLSYSYATIAAGMRDTFGESGWGAGWSYKGRLPCLRIDYIFCSPEWRPQGYRIPHTPFSDHDPAVCRLVWQ